MHVYEYTSDRIPGLEYEHDMFLPRTTYATMSLTLAFLMVSNTLLLIRQWEHGIVDLHRNSHSATGRSQPLPVQVGIPDGTRGRSTQLTAGLEMHRVIVCYSTYIACSDIMFS